MTTNLYAVVDDGVVIKYHELASAPTLLGKPYRKILPVEDVRPQNVDTLTHRIVGPSVTVLTDKVVRTWTAEAKTTQDVDDDKAIMISQMDRLILRVLFNHENRIRALESKQPVTIDQFKTGLKQVL